MRKNSVEFIEGRKSDILDAMAEEKSYTKAARRLGMNRYTFRSCIERYGLKYQVRRMLDDWQTRMKGEVFRLASEGKLDREIAMTVGMSVSSVARMRMMQGIRKRRGLRKSSEPSIRNVMMADLSDRYSYSDIARAFGCSRQNVHMIVMRVRRRVEVNEEG